MKDLEKAVIRKRKLIKKHQEELSQMLEACTHEGFVEEKSSYYGGSYTNTAYTRYWNQCTLCGRKSEETLKEHGWYG